MAGRGRGRAGWIGSGPTALWQRLTGRGPNPGPLGDPSGFYRALDPGTGPRGEPLRSEDLAKDPALPPGTRLLRLVYRTLDAGGAPVAASLALALPARTAEAPIALWGHGAVGTAPGCAPSRAGFDAPYAAELLNAGVIVAAPDYTGLGMEGVPYPYLHGVSAGRSVLDAARAVRTLEPGAGSRVAMYGLSAGGHAVLWANQLARGDDGAGLDVVGVVALAPVGDLVATMAHYARTEGLASYAVQLAGTWGDVVAALDPAIVLTPAAIERRSDLGEQCLGQLLAGFRGPPGRWLRPEGFGDAGWSAALLAQSPGAEAGVAPVLVVQGGRDTSVLPTWTAQLVTDLRTGGTAATLVVEDGADHGTIIGTAGHRATAWLLERLVPAV